MGLVEVLRHLPRLLALRRDVYRRTLRVQAGGVHRHRCTGFQPRARKETEGRRRPHRALREPVDLGLARAARGKDRPQRRPRAVPVSDGAADLRAPRRRCALRRPSARGDVPARRRTRPPRARNSACRRMRRCWRCCRAAASAKSAGSAPDFLEPRRAAAAAVAAICRSSRRWPTPNAAMRSRRASTRHSQQSHPLRQSLRIIDGNAHAP